MSAIAHVLSTVVVTNLDVIYSSAAIKMYEVSNKALILRLSYQIWFAQLVHGEELVKDELKLPHDLFIGNKEYHFIYKYKKTNKFNHTSFYGAVQVYA